MKRCIGLFGTCGSSTWRDKFMDKYDEENIIGEPVLYFNPQVEDWKPEDAFKEAEHLANDDIILFPITGETYGTGSLSEVGFGVLSAIKLDDRRDFVVMIDMELDPELMKDKERSKENLRARALVMAHLNKLNLPNVHMVGSLDDMLSTSIILHHANTIKNTVAQFSIKK